MEETFNKPQTEPCTIHGVMHRFSYRWTLKDAVFTKDKGKVFSCFACGGGKIAGNVLRLGVYAAYRNVNY